MYWTDKETADCVADPPQ